MSASRENKPAHQTAEDKDRRQSMFYGAIILAVLIAAVVVYIFNSGLLQQNATAATVNGEKVGPGYLGYYYQNAVQQEAQMAQYGYSSYDPKTSNKDQIQNKEDGTTYHDYFVNQALDSASQTISLVQKAEEEKFALSDEAKELEKNTIGELKTQAIVSGFNSDSAFLKALYGSYMTVDLYEKVVHDQVVASYYGQAYIDSLTYTDEEIGAYYDENKDNLDTYNYSYMVLQAKPEAQVDEDGEEIEMTEEETAAALDAAKAIQAAKADEAKAALEAGEDITTLGTELEAYGAYANQATVGGSLNSSFAEWMKDESRTAGDMTIAEYDGGATTYVYYVVRFEGRSLVEDATAEIRHILVDSGATDGEPTEEQYETAKTTAEDLLAQWKAGDATAESFGILAAANSADTSSAANGGLLTGVSPASGYVDTFTDWAMDPARQAGDTGVVKNEGSSIKGYHAMYFQAWGEPVWKLTANNAMMQADFTDWSTAIEESTEATLGDGAQYIGQ